MRPRHDMLALIQLRQEVRRCERCALHKERTRAVPGNAKWDADVILIGEAPGAQEDEQGVPFVGRSGQLLREALAAGGLEPDSIYITNVVKCRPPGNRRPRAAERRACRAFLDRQLDIVRPKLIITVGSTALQEFVPGASVMALRGVVHRWAQGLPLFPLVHPAATLRRPGLKKSFMENAAQAAKLCRQYAETS